MHTEPFIGCMQLLFPKLFGTIFCTGEFRLQRTPYPAFRMSMPRGLGCFWYKRTTIITMVSSFPLLVCITLGPSISLPCGTTLLFSYIGYALVTSFHVMDHQHPCSHHTFVPCMPYMPLPHVPHHHNDIPFWFRALLSSSITLHVLHNLPTFPFFFTHPLSNPITIVFLLDAFVVVWLHQLNTTCVFTTCDSHVCIAQFEGLALLVACAFVVAITCYKNVFAWQVWLLWLQVHDCFSLPFQSYPTYMFVHVLCVYMRMFLFFFIVMLIMNVLYFQHLAFPNAILVPTFLINILIR